MTPRKLIKREQPVILTDHPAETGKDLMVLSQVLDSKLMRKYHPNQKLQKNQLLRRLIPIIQPAARNWKQNHHVVDKLVLAKKQVLQSLTNPHLQYPMKALKLI